MKTRRIIALVIVALCSFSAFAIEPRVSFEQNVIQTWGVDQGLPQATVVSVTQTPDGYVWAATQEGFVRFDGSSFSVYDKTVSTEIHNNMTQALLSARDGSLYAAMNGGGVVQVSRDHIRAYTMADGLPSNTATALYQSPDGSIWIGTQKGLARRFSDGRITVVAAGDRLPNPAVKALAEDWSGQLWIGTMNGIATLQKGLLSRREGDGFPVDDILALCATRDGSMWIGTHDHGLFRYRAGKLRAYTEADGLPSKMINAIYEDRHGTLWIGTLDHGFGRFQDEQFDFNLQAAGIGNKPVRAFLEDREDNLWVGSALGLTRVAEPRVLTFTTVHGLLSNNIRTVYADASGTLWVGTGSGVQSLDGGRHFSTELGLSSNKVMSLWGGRDGSLWVGTFNAGVNRVLNGNITTYNTSNGLRSNLVLSIYEDRAGVVWVGTAKGLQRIVNGTIAPDVPKLSGEAIEVVNEDRSGALWVGTQDGGLNRIANGVLSSFTSQSGLQSDFILALHEDSAGSMWVGTAGGGLSRYKAGKWSTITTREGLFDDSVFSILDDDDGNFWMSCNKGIFRVSRQQLDDVADGHLAKVNYIVYGRADGMRTRECNGGTQPAGWKTVDGKLWFATADGLACIDPKSANVAAVPPLIIEGMFADRHRIESSATQKPLDAGTRSIEFHYSGINFAAPGKVHYQYKLEGYDKEWIDAGSRRLASYMNLKPGTYRFYVRAANDDGPWNTVSTAFRQRPFVYQSPWFLATCVIFFFGIAGVAHRSRVKTAVISAERFKLLFDRNLAAEYRATEAGGILDCNDACAKMFGYESRAELMAHGLSDMYWSDQDREAIFARLRAQGTVNNLEISLRRAGDAEISVLMNATLVIDAQGHEIIEATLVDISERKRAEADIQYKAHHDVLTGLPNRSLFNDRLSIALNYVHRQRSQLAVLCLDLDCFNVVNDAFGRVGGDGVLKVIGERLTACVREEDSVARVGDDEFTLLLMKPNTVNDVTTVARKILQAVARPITLNGHEFNVTTSIGIAMYPQDGEDAESLMKSADTTLYRAKEAGPNSYQLCSPVLARKAAERLSLENAMRQAIEQHEFMLYYQPQLDIRTQKVTGMEALLRWNRPGKGIIRPAEFINVAEETRMIVPISEWAIEEACRQARIWHDAGAAMRMSVNVSPHHFQQPNIVATISEALAKTGFDPHDLEIEITEGTAMQNPDFTADVLLELKSLGMSIAIDDFGVGHSSLNYLKRFPIDALKIDRSFVMDINRGGTDGAIVSAVIAMARALQIRVIAEGVETEEQFEFLREHGCYEFQGYLFSRPMPVDALGDMVRKAIPDTYNFARTYGQNALHVVPDIDH